MVGSLKLVGQLFHDHRFCAIAQCGPDTLDEVPTQIVVRVMDGDLCRRLLFEHVPAEYLPLSDVKGIEGHDPGKVLRIVEFLNS